MPITPLSDVTQGVYIALIAGVQVLLLTVVQALITARKERRDAAIRAEEKREQYAREDLVAARVAAVSQQAAAAQQLLVAAQKESIKRTDEVARLAVESGQHIAAQLTEITEQGKKIHILVNSDMTAARTNERDQARLTLIALRRVQALSANLGLPIDTDEEKAIKIAEERITELDHILADRHEAQVKVEQEYAADRNRRATDAKEVE